LLAGESPVKVWREKRGRSQRELAAAAGVGAGYLAEIETGRKPGSVVALARLGKALQVQIEDLIISD
jgi:transcriptional regulator with XRE-family HTH domain